MRVSGENLFSSQIFAQELLEALDRKRGNRINRPYCVFSSVNKLEAQEKQPKCLRTGRKGFQDSAMTAALLDLALVYEKVFVAMNNRIRLRPHARIKNDILRHSFQIFDGQEDFNTSLRFHRKCVTVLHLRLIRIQGRNVSKLIHRALFLTFYPCFKIQQFLRCVKT